MTARRCVVCVGTHHEHWFVSGVERLERSLREVGFDGGVLTWKGGEYPPGSPTQEQCSHGFKPWAVKAAQDAGYTTVAWLDASVWAVAPIEPLFEFAERRGFYLTHNGNNVGQFSSDASLEIFGVTREEALRVREVATGFVVLDLTKELPAEFQRRWLHYTTFRNGAAYNGPDTNEGSVVSGDARVIGHRHDQTVASLILHQIGVRSCVPFGDSYIDTGNRPRPGKLLTYRGL